MSMVLLSHAFLVFILSLLSVTSLGKIISLSVSFIVAEFWCCCFSEITVVIKDCQACRMKNLYLTFLTAL